MRRPPYRTILSAATRRQQEPLAAIPLPVIPTRKETIMSDTQKKPAGRVYLHPIQAAIWRNESSDGIAFYSTTFERRYQDKEGKWQSTNSFSAEDLLLLAKVADLAHTEVVKLRAADRKAQQLPAEFGSEAA